MEQESNVNLKWDTHQITLKSVFDNLLDSESLADCTIGAEDQHLKTHKIILSAFSRYFEVLFSRHHQKDMVIILPGVQFHILKSLMLFIYRGEVVIPQDELDGLLQLADFLQVKGLSHGMNVVSEKKYMNKMRKKSPTLLCHVSPEINKHSDSPELLEVSGSSSQSENLQLQDYTKVSPISLPACKRRKSDWRLSKEEPTHKQDYVAPSQTIVHNFPICESEVPDKSNLASDMFSDTKLRPSLSYQLSVCSERNFSAPKLSGKELISTKPSVVRTASCTTVSDNNTSVETFSDTKEENCSGLNQAYVPGAVIDSDDSQQENISDDNTFDMSVLTESSFCGGESFTQQIQQAEWTKAQEETSAKNDRFRCQTCDRSYRRYKCLVRHLKYECGKEPQFQCPQCSVWFTHKHTLKMHMVRHKN